MLQPETPTTIYIAGPMAGREDFNFPAFDEAKDMLLANGFVPISPADMDRELGFLPGSDAETTEVSARARADYMARDFPEVAKADAILLLDGWEESTGANMELLVALMAGKIVWIEVEDIEGGRQVIEAYPHPDLFMISKHLFDVYADQSAGV